MPLGASLQRRHEEAEREALGLGEHATDELLSKEEASENKRQRTHRQHDLEQHHQ